MKETEANIEKMFVKIVKHMGGMALKWTSPQNRGVPDRIAFFPGGLVCLVELKRPGGTLSPLQLKFMQKFTMLDVPYIVIDSFRAVHQFKENIALALEGGSNEQ